MPAKANLPAIKPANVVIVEDHQMFREWLGVMFQEVVRTGLVGQGGGG